MKYKVGDKVYVIHLKEFHVIDNILEDNQDLHDGKYYPIWINDLPFNLREDQVIPEHIYNSKLFNVLK